MKSIIEYIPDFLEYCELEKGLSDKSIKNYDNFLRPLKEFLVKQDIPDLRPDQLTNQHIWDYRLYLSRARKLSKTTQNYYLIVLRGILSYFAEKDLPSVPLNKVKLAKIVAQDRKIKYLSLDLVEKLLLAPNIKNIRGLRDRAILEVLFSTGLRVAELTSLNKGQFNFQSIPMDKDYELMITGKGGYQRTVYFSPRALEFVKAYLQKRTDFAEPLFINHSRNIEPSRLSIRAIESMVGKYARLAGINVDVTPHTMRHSYATDLLTQGVDLRLVQEFLGHQNILTTQIYTHVTNKKLKEIHERYHSGKRLKE
jgi:integrase/recombinase XerD